MAYDFDSLLSGSAHPKAIGRGPNIPPSSVRQNEIISMVDKRLIFGEDIRDNPVPIHTDEVLSGLYTIFQDPQGQRFAMSESLLSKHLLLLGGIGSGKTNVFNFVLESLLKKQTTDDIIFIFDTKGDFYGNFYQPYNPNHILIGNGREFHTETYCWNVFGELEGGDGSFDSFDEFSAKEIAKQLFEGRGSETQPFFELASADLIAKVLIDFERQARTTGDRSALNNQALANWLRAADLRSYTEIIQRNPDFASAYLYFGDPGQSTQQKLSPQALGVFGYINAMCSDLFAGVFAQSRPGQEFSMRSLVRDRGKNGGKTVVFIEYDMRVGAVLTPMYRLLIDLALKEALGFTPNRRGNVIFIIDEFKLLPNLMHIDDALNFGRGLGIKVVAGLQSIDQIYANYGEERGRAIVSGFMNSFCFYTPDCHSRQYISERFGENCSHLVYRVQNAPASYQREGRTIEDWDILKLGIGQAAVDLVGQKPFLFQFSDFTKPHDIY